MESKDSKYIKQFGGQASGSTSHSKTCSKDEVALFWDINTTPVPQGYDMDMIVPDINRALGRLHSDNPTVYPNYTLGDTKIVIGDIYDRHFQNQFESLKAQGFTYWHIPERKFVCSVHASELKIKNPNQKLREGAPDTKLVELLIDYVCENRLTLPQNILIISGDYNLHGAMDRLWEAGNTIFLACRRDSHSSYRDSADFSWLWEDNGGMLQGVAPHITE